jgi:hypothetical protein
MRKQVVLPQKPLGNNVLVVEQHIRRAYATNETAVAKTYVAYKPVSAEIDDPSGIIEH